MSKLFRDSVLYAVGSMLIRSLGIILIPLYTTYFSVEEYGLLAILVVYLSLFSTVFMFGINSAATRFYFSEDADSADRRELFGASFLLLLILPPIVALVIAPAFVFTAHHVYETPFLPLFGTVLLIGAMKPVERLFTGLLRCQKRAFAYVTFYFALFLTQFVAIYVLVAHFQLGLKGQIYGQLIATCVFWLAAIILLVPHVDVKINRSQATRLLKFGIPLIPFFIFTWLVVASPRILLERLAGMSDVGLFALASQFSGILLLLGNASDNALVPHYYETANSDNAAASLGSLATKFLALAAVVSLAVYIFADDFIYLLADPKFHPAVTYVPLLVLATYLRLAYRVFHWNLMSMDKTKTVSTLKGVNFGLLVALIFVFAGWAGFGIWGVIWAILISDAITLAIGFRLSQSARPVTYEVRKLAAALLTIGTAVAAVQLVRVEPGSVSSLLAGLLISVLAAVVAMKFAGIRLPHRGNALSQHAPRSCDTVNE